MKSPIALHRESVRPNIGNAGVLAAGVAAVLADAHKWHYCLAAEAGAVLGQMMITFEWSDWRNGWMWWIQSVFVRPEARRRGVFRTLYQHVYQAARDDPEVIGLRLYVERDNRPAQETYHQLGMAQAGNVEVFAETRRRKDAF